MIRVMKKVGTGSVATVRCTKMLSRKKINGKYYYFNNHGQMLYEWINGVKANVASNAKLDSDSIELPLLKYVT